jgi:hypothetical protein
MANRGERTTKTKAGRMAGAEAEDQNLLSTSISPVDVTLQDRLNPQRSDRQKKIEKQIARLGLSINDMKRCQEYTSAWDESLSEVLRSALITSAIIAYTRPFSGNEEHDKATPRPQFSEGDLALVERQLHKHLCEVRNQAIAHSDFGMNTSRALDFPGDSGVLMATKMYEPLLESRRLPDIHALATKVEQLLRAKLSDQEAAWRATGSA